jgi:uncharacterized protein DUF6489
MKFTMNVDCTAEEARAFLGLPNVSSMQERMIKEVEERMRGRIQNLDPEALVRTWIPISVQSLGELQKMFWNQLGMKQPEPSKDRKWNSQSARATPSAARARRSPRKTQE